ncbi:MAG: spermidine synthase [Burkholderiaceae bacterium]|nr:spermidine synthase [Burkholderiaceae bacterium]
MSEPVNPLPPITLSEENGVRYLHFGTSWIQGAMRIDDPDAVELEYVRQMMAWLLFNPQPWHIVQLGLGSGALAKCCHRHLPESRLTVVELNPAVIAICREQFALPPDDARFEVLAQDALAWLGDAANHGSADVLQVDLYDDKAEGPVFSSPEFYQACARCLTPRGMLTVNLYGDEDIHLENIAALTEAFDAVVWLPLVDEENLVALAFKDSPSMDFAVLRERAQAIRQQTGLEADKWVDGLQQWMYC